MKLKLDENLPRSLADLLRSHGHDAETVIDEGLAGASDDEVLAAASSEGRLLLTLDRRFADIRRHPPGSHPGIVVLRLADHSALSATAAVEKLVTHHDLDELAGTITVVHGGLLRIRRTPE